MNQDSIMYLQSKLNKDSIQSKFRTKTIGGLHQDDVLNYICGIEDDFQTMYQKLRKDMSELQASKNNLMAEMETYKAEAAEEKHNLQMRLDEVQMKLDSYIDDYNDKDLVAQSISAKADSDAVHLQNEILQWADERRGLEKLISDSRLEIEGLKKYAKEIEEENSTIKSNITGSSTVSFSESNQTEEMEKMRIELLQQVEDERATNEKLNIMTTMLNDKVIELEETLAANLKDLEEKKKISAKAEQDLMLGKTLLSSYKISGFKNELATIYQQLENLTEEQVKANNDLQQQLGIEQLRANNAEMDVEEQLKSNYELQQRLNIEQLRSNKAEKGLAELNKWTGELKEKITGEQDVFSSQLNQLLQSQNQFASDVNGIFVNINDYNEMNS